MAASGRFDKDLGYLMPFLDRVAQAAPELEDPAARAELTRLMSEEKQRWARIRELLGGAKGRPDAVALPPPARPTPPARVEPPPRLPEYQPEALGLTVGSLRKG